MRMKRGEECQGIFGSTDRYLSLGLSLPGKRFGELDTGADRRPARLSGRRVSRSAGAVRRYCGTTPAALRRAPSLTDPRRPEGRPGVSAGAGTKAPRVDPFPPTGAVLKPLVSPVWEPCCRAENPPPPISSIWDSSELWGFLG